MGIIVMKFSGSVIAGPEGILAAAKQVRANVDPARRDGGAAGQNSVLAVAAALPGVAEALVEAARAAAAADLAAAKKLCAEIGNRHVVAARALSPRGCADTEAEIQSIMEALDARLQGVRLVGELSDRSMDEIAAAGDRLSSLLLALALGAPCVDARSLLRTDSRFGRARVDMAAAFRLVIERLAPLLGPGGVAVTQGSIGSDSLGSSTTLGRGGSDYSASLFGAALRASEIQIWSDSEGILTCDPSVVPQAKTIEVLGYEEASELAAFGAKILHPAAIRPAFDAGIPVTVRSAGKPDGLYSTIRPGSSSGKAVAAIAMRRNVALISVRQEAMMEQAGFLARLFAAFGRLGVSVDLVATSEICVSISLDMGAPLKRLASELAELGSVDIESDKAVVAVVGDMLKETPALLRKTFDALGDIDVDMVSMGANDINLSFVLDAAEADKALRRLHAAFFEDDSGPAGGLGGEET